jgi:hypothetical protein
MPDADETADPAVVLIYHPRMLRRSPLLLAIALLGCGGAPPEPSATPPPPVQPEDDLEPEKDPETVIDVIAAKPTEILLDGKPIGTTPINGFKVTPGTHEVTFVDPARGNRTMMVTLQEGEGKVVQSDPVPPIIEDKSEGEKKDKE